MLFLGWRPAYSFVVLWLTVLAAGLGVAARTASAQVHIRPRVVQYVPPRPVFAGLHVAMPEDSAIAIFHSIARRVDTLHVDSVILMESDSVRVFGKDAYMQLQFLHKRLRTIVINYHPLGGGDYLQLRDLLDNYLERYFGRGVEQTNASLVYRRWETEDGTSELSHSDKYMRIFIRLGKPRV